MSYPRLAARLYGAPLLILPDKAKMIEEVFRSHLTGERRILAMDDDGPAETAEQRAEREQARRVGAYAGIQLANKPDKPYALTTSGIALLPVLGTLVQRGSWMDAASGLTSYDNVASLLDRAMADPEVRAVLLEIDSPGGEAAGVMDLAGRVQAASKRKPVWSVASEQAYSAAYWLASSAEFAYAALTGGVGSIGALMLHVDQSKRDSMMGYRYTYIASGAKKADGNQHEPISDAMLSWAQNEVDRTGGLFASAVATNRGIAVENVLALEGGLLTPPEALDAGYVDGINTLIEVVALLNAELQQPGSTGARLAASRSSMTTKETDMTDKIAAKGNEADKKHTDAELDAARTAAKAEGATEAEAKGRAEGVKAERERVGAILGCEEAKDRTKLALHLALQTDGDAASAKKLLAQASKESGGSFASAMASLGNPKVGTETGLESSGGVTRIDTKGIYEARRQASAAYRQ